MIPPWADTDALVPIRSEENWFIKKEKLDKKFIVMYSGNHGRCHDIETVLETAKICTDENIIFYFIGDGIKKELVEDYITQNRPKNIRSIPYQEMSKLSIH